MRTHSVLSIAAAAMLTITITLPAGAYIPGDGKGKPEADCFIGLEGYESGDQTPFGKKGKPAIQCTDGDECDLDGSVNGSCQFSIAVAVNQGGVAGCTPAALKKVKAKAKTKGTKINFSTTFQPPLDGSSAVSAFVNFPVLVKKFGTPKAKFGKGTVSMSATKPKDKDKFTFVCNPDTSTSTTTTTMPIVSCPTNATGDGQGPRQLNMVVNGNGADLDNGISGQSHNFPVPIGTTLSYCLTDCDGTDPECLAEGSTGGEDDVDSLNGATFGPPLPLFSAGVPVCVINEYKEATIRGTANVDTGEFVAEQNGTPTPVVLNSRVFQCLANQVCPRCNNGTCQGGARNGQSCTVDGTVIVNNPPAVTNDSYNLSNDCPPGGGTCSALGSIEVVLDLTSGTSMKEANAAGNFPCPGQTQHDECQGSAECTVDCSPSGTNSIDPKGGVSQFCCSDAQSTPCFPTSAAAGSVAIIRTGEAAPPTPAWSSDPTTYPKTGAGKLAATFCEAATNSIAVNGTAGLPGPGSLILPGDTTWIGNAQ